MAVLLASILPRSCPRQDSAREPDPSGDASQASFPGLVEAIGAAVHTVAGDERSLKVTRPLDLALARLLADQEQAD
mgnify:CR=1 FL=1